ncbi:hypothetical protein YC2023_071119 [Brassica napus]
MLTSHNYPASALIFNRITSRTNLLKPLETATTRIRKRPQPQPQPLRLNQSGPKSSEVLFKIIALNEIVFENFMGVIDPNKTLSSQLSQRGTLGAEKKLLRPGWERVKPQRSWSQSERDSL